jgi:hypothetical protein
MTLVSDIKLIRTDTTLDLSQKAEKGILLTPNPDVNVPQPWPQLQHTVWDKSCFHIPLLNFRLKTVTESRHEDQFASLDSVICL